MSQYIHKHHNVSVLLYHYACPAKYRRVVVDEKVEEIDKRKKDLIKLGGWNSGSLTEDIEYTLRLYKNNKRIVYLRNLECNNEVPYIASDLYKQQMRWGYGVITSYKKHLFTLLTSKIQIHRKILSLLHGFGYLMPIMIMCLFTFGVLSFVIHKPGPMNIPLFASELAINVTLTSGLLIASIIALKREKKTKYTLKMLVASFSIGLVTTYYVNKGIIKEILGKPMQWFLLNKKVD